MSVDYIHRSRRGRRNPVAIDTAIAHITVCTFEDVVLPQMVIMSFSPREALLFFEHVEVHVVAHVALRCLLQRLEFPWVVGAVA